LLDLHALNLAQHLVDDRTTSSRSASVSDDPPGRHLPVAKTHRATESRSPTDAVATTASTVITVSQ